MNGVEGGYCLIYENDGMMWDVVALTKQYRRACLLNLTFPCLGASFTQYHTAWNTLNSPWDSDCC